MAPAKFITVIEFEIHIHRQFIFVCINEYFKRFQVYGKTRKDDMGEKKKRNVTVTRKDKKEGFEREITAISQNQARSKKTKEENVIKRLG